MSKKNKKPVKKVTAPVTYDPGKGRPKEYLAYLNWQEMEALKRLNGNNMEWGPKGLPSFPPSGTTGKSSSTGARGPTGPQGQPRSSPAGNKGGAPGSVSRTPTSTGARGPTGPAGQPRTSPAGGRPGAVSRPSGSGFAGIGGGGARDSGQAAARAATATPTRFAEPSRGSAASTARISGGVPGGNQRDAQVRQAAASRSISKAAATPALRDDRSKTVNVGPMGTPVRVGAPSGQEGRIVPRATVTTPMATQGPSFRSPLEARIENRFAINDARLRASALGPEGVPSVSQIAAENARRLNAVKMAQQYSQYRSPPSVAPPAPQGVFGPRAGEGTGYLRTADMPGMIVTGTEGMPSARFAPRYNAEATLRAHEESKRVSPKITDRVPIEGAPTVGRSAVTPSYPSLAASDGLYKTAGRDPAVERALAEAGFDPTGRRLEAMIDPSIPGRNQAANRSAALRPIAGGWPGQSAIPPNPPVYTPGKVYYDRVLPDMPGLEGRSRIPYRDTMPERILEVENLMSDAGIRKPISGFAAPRGIADLYGVPDEAVPGSQIDVNNIPRVPTVILPSVDREIPRAVTPSEYSGYGTFNVPDVPSPIRPASGKIFTDPFADRVPAYDISGEPVNPSVVMGTPSGTVAFPQTEAIAPPPSVIGKDRSRLPLTFYSPEGKEYVISREQFDSLSQEDKNRLAEYAAHGQVVTPPKPRLRPTTPSASPPRPRSRPADLMDSYLNLENTSEGVPGPETPSEDYVEPMSGESMPPSQESASPKDGLTKEQREKAQKEIRRGNRVAGQFIGGVTGPLGGLAARGGLKLYEKAKLEQLERYAAMPPAEKLAAEKRNPELIGWANRLGIDHQSDYGDYLAWADRSGLRAPPTREGGGRESSGIADLVSDATGGEEPSAPEAPSTSSGRRPDIYYMWDLGVNIPSPGDPNYTQYQTYLAERLAAQRAMGYV